MRKLLVFFILIVGIFFYRGHLTGYWIEFFGPGEEDPMIWLNQEREELYSELASMDYASAIHALNGFESDIQTELAENLKNTNNDEKKSAYQMNLICELAVVYKHIAIAYLNHGEDDLYIEYIGKSQTKLSECADVKS